MIQKSAGVIIILNNKILLCHPTNSNWFGTYSFPKGKVEIGESDVDAAVRELREETSIIIHPDRIKNSKPIIVDYVNKKGIKYKRLILYTAYINSLTEIGLQSEILSKENLQLTEVDWAGFLSKEDAKSRIFHRVYHLLDELNIN